jgi:hypothetical protein
VRPSGITGAYSSSATRSGIFGAYRERMVYGTTGERIRVEFSLQSEDTLIRMGEKDGVINISGCPDSCPEVTFDLHILGDRTPFSKVELFWYSEETGEFVTGHTFDTSSSPYPFTYDDYELDAEVYPLEEGIYSPDKENIYYLRVECKKGEDETYREQAWSSPIWVYFDTTPLEEDEAGDTFEEEEEAGCGCRIKGKKDGYLSILILLSLFVPLFQIWNHNRKRRCIEERK